MKGLDCLNPSYKGIVCLSERTLNTLPGRQRSNISLRVLKGLFLLVFQDAASFDFPAKLLSLLSPFYSADLISYSLSTYALSSSRFLLNRTIFIYCMFLPGAPKASGARGQSSENPTVLPVFLRCCPFVKDCSRSP